MFLLEEYHIIVGKMDTEFNQEETTVESPVENDAVESGKINIASLPLIDKITLEYMTNRRQYRQYFIRIIFV